MEAKKKGLREREKKLARVNGHRAGNIKLHSAKRNHSRWPRHERGCWPPVLFSKVIRESSRKRSAEKIWNRKAAGGKRIYLAEGEGGKGLRGNEEDTWTRYRRHQALISARKVPSSP